MATARSFPNVSAANGFRGALANAKGLPEEKFGSWRIELTSGRYWILAYTAADGMANAIPGGTVEVEDGDATVAAWITANVGLIRRNGESFK
jgi:hypothetical protein